MIGVENERINDHGYFVIDEPRYVFLKTFDPTLQANDDNISHCDMRTPCNT